FLMDCDTTGIEPDFSLVKIKELVGGGQMTIVNRTVPRALRKLGYSDHEIGQIEAYVNERHTIVGAPHLKDEHLPVFDVAVGEIFLTDIGKDGSTLRGMMNAFATAISIGLQYGVPLETFVRKFSYMRFDPEGMTTNPEIPFAKSLPDYIMRWLASRFLEPSVHEELGIMSEEVRTKKLAEEAALHVGGNGGS